MLPTLVILLSLGGNASVDESFEVAAPVQQVTKWLLKNQNAIPESMACRVVSRQGNLIRIQKRTFKGDFDFIMEDSAQVSRNGTTWYTATLKQSLAGGMKSHSIRVVLYPSRDGTYVTVEASAVIPRLPNWEVRAGLNAAKRGFRAMMVSQFRVP